MDRDQQFVLDAGPHNRHPTQMTVAEAEKELEAIVELSHGPTCAMRVHAGAECTCGKIDRLIELEDRIRTKPKNAGISETPSVHAQIPPKTTPATVVARRNAKPQKLVFAAADGSCAVVVTAPDLVDAGVPIHPETGEELEFLGATDDEVPTGKVDPESLAFD